MVDHESMNHSEEEPYFENDRLFERLMITLLYPTYRYRSCFKEFRPPIFLRIGIVHTTRIKPRTSANLRHLNEAPPPSPPPPHPGQSLRDCEHGTS